MQQGQPKRHSNSAQQGMLLGLLAVGLFAMTLPATRFSVQYFDPLAVGFGRSAIASVLAAGLLWRAKVSWPTRQQTRLLLLTASGVVLGFPILSAYAMQTLPAASGGVLMGLLPLLTAVFGARLNHERPRAGFWVCSVLATGVVSGYALRGGVAPLTGGDLLLLIATLLAAWGYALGGILATQMPGWQVICWCLVFSAPVTWAGWLWQGVAEPSATPLAWGAFLYLALISQLFGFFLWNRGLALGGITRVSQLQLLQPFLTLFLAARLLQEHVDGWTFSSAAAVVLLVALGRRWAR